VLEEGERPGARRDLGVGAQHRKIGLPAIELRQRLGIVGIERDLQAQPRRTVLEHSGELGGDGRLIAVGVADGERQRLGIAQPNATARDRRNVRIRVSSANSSTCRAVTCDNLRAWERLFGRRRWDLSAHGSHPMSGQFAAPAVIWTVRRDRKYLKKNDNSQAPMISAGARIANRPRR
jgi:hypothetical protein